jgi:SAM-dependent methyltransferase
LFWDTPVPSEHTFECTYPLLRNLCAPYLELDRAFGISMGWGVPGWSRLLARLPSRAADAVLAGLDRVARQTPRLADVLVTVWRPRPTRRNALIQAARSGDRVDANDLLYPSRLQAEADFWARIDFGGGFFALARPSDRMANAAYTGDPACSWLDDLIGRGPFAHAAVLGCDEGGYEAEWLARGASAQLDVYELSARVMRAIRRGIRRDLRRRARCVRTDLNFVHLPPATYDAIWSSGCLHHIVNLEALFAEVERALKPGGLFAIRDYVGERRMRFAPERLARVNAALQQIPARFRRVTAVEPPPLNGLSPFCGVRADDIVRLATARFDVIHHASSGALFPLNFAVDLDAIAREAPEILQQLQQADEAALREPGAHPCGVYLVLRKRAST